MTGVRLIRLAGCAALAIGTAGCERLSAIVPAQFRSDGTATDLMELRRRVVGGRASDGRRIIEENAHGCATCHTIPGVASARGVVGPPLTDLAQRSFIAGTLPNEAGVLLAFLLDPPTLVPKTAMPNTGLSDGEARHVAAYLYSLRGRRHEAR